MNREFSDGTFTNSSGESPNHGNGLFFRLGATYHLTDNDDIYANGFGMFGHNWGHSTTLYNSNVPGNWITNLDYSRNRETITACTESSGIPTDGLTTTAST